MINELVVGDSITLDGFFPVDQQLQIVGLGLTAAGVPYFDPYGVDAGDAADLVLGSDGSSTLVSRTRFDPVVPDFTLVRTFR